MNQIVAVPAYTDPRNPAAAGGSINFPVDEHPVRHSNDYGAAFAEYEAPVERDERDEWTKAQWAELAVSYELPTGGNKSELVDRVLEHEAALEAERNGES